MSKDSHTLTGWIIFIVLFISGPVFGVWAAYVAAIYLGPLWLAYNQLWYLDPQNPGTGDLDKTKGLWLLFLVLLLVLPMAFYGRLTQLQDQEKIKNTCLMQTYSDEELLANFDEPSRSAYARQLQGARTPFSIRVCNDAGVPIECTADNCTYSPPS